ncbi:MAG: CpaF family protein [Planctomycetaceae bacterium]|nr:CpaF family protein [Planctomycetaceae bacterium]
MSSITPQTTRDTRPTEQPEIRFQRLKTRIHSELVESLDLSIIGQMTDTQFNNELKPLVQDIVRRRGAELSQADQQRMMAAVIDEVFGLGPLEPLMRDGTVSEILVNGAHEVYVERRGRLELTEVRFADNHHVMRIIQRIVGRVGRRIDEVNPMVDARLPDGSRVNAIVPPLALRGPTLSIRRFGTKPMQMRDLITHGSLTGEMMQFLAAAVESRMSVLISGGAGAGKTTFLNALTAFVPEDERLITIEDSAELVLQHKHVVSLETRIANTAGEGAVTPRELLRNSLRMRPDRIIVGEVRGAEALDMLQAMNTGHEGSLTTIHANDAREALTRLEMMVGMAGFEFPVSVVRQYVAGGIRLVVHVARLKGGVRKITSISELVEIKDGSYVMQEIFGFVPRGVDDRGMTFGEFMATGNKPACATRFESAGVSLPDSLFQKRRLGADVTAPYSAGDTRFPESL